MANVEISGVKLMTIKRSSLPPAVEMGKVGNPTYILISEKKAAIWRSGKPINQENVIYQADEGVASSLDPDAW